MKEWARGYRAVPGFKKQWGLRSIRADHAYAHLKAVKGENVKPGQGVTIGFVDSGIDKGHPAFENVTVTETLLQRARDEIGARMSHGTAVASVAAGGLRTSGSSQGRAIAYSWTFDQERDAAHHGVAWGADIAMFSIPLGSGGGIYEPVSLRVLNAVDRSNFELYNNVLGKNIDILNLSIGYTGIIENYSEDQLRNNFSKTIAAFAQAGAQEKVIIVRSAGNAHGDECRLNEVSQCVKKVGQNVKQGMGTINASSVQIMPGLPARIPELRGHYIAVVATDYDGSITGFSNRCGIAADWCIAAPGEAVRVAYFGPHRGRNGVRAWKAANGTSFAAPMVSGGLAVMKQLFRGQLSNTELVTRLYATAKKTGIHANRAIYGQGLMDLGAATNPWGMAAFMGTGQAVGQQGGGGSVGQQGSSGVGLRSTSLRLGPAMGDGLTEALAQQEVAAFDSLGAPFWFPADNFVVASSSASATTGLNRLLQDPEPARPTTDTWQVRGQLSQEAAEAGHLLLTDGADRLSLSAPHDWSATLFHRPRDGAGTHPLTGLAMTWQPESLPSLTLQAGWLGEQETLLGSAASGAFGHLAGDTTFLSARLAADAPAGWKLTAQGELGTVRPAFQGMFLQDVSLLGTSAFRLEASRSMAAGGATVRFAVEQPLRVTSGAATLELPTGRTRSGQVVGQTVTAGMAPTGQQLDLSAQIDRPLAGGVLSVKVIRSRQPNHQATAPPQWTFLAGYKGRF